MTTRLILTVVLACALTACTPVMDAAVKTVQTAVRGEPAPDASRLNPKFRYLRVTIEGRVAFLALGNVDDHPQGPIEVWFSARKEVLRIQNGRLVGAVGLTTEWRDVLLPSLPAWSALVRVAEPHRWVRTRDVMPGYRYGVRDALALRVTTPPAKSALQGVEATTLTWFEERLQNEIVASREKPLVGLSDERALPPARYAVEMRDGRETVIYGEQCLAVELCFTWQRWGVAKP